MNFEIIYTTKLIEDVNFHKKSGSKKLVAKIDKLISELRTDPENGTGNPEQLKYYADTVWSRRIDQKHRLIYEILVETRQVKLLSAWGHYDDK